MISGLAAPVNLANEAGTAFNDVRNAARADQIGRLNIQYQTGANQKQGLDIAAEQRKQAATAAHQQAIQSALTKDQNGIPVLDPQGYVSQMAQRGFGDVAMENIPKIQQALEHVRQTAEAGIQREMRDQANPALMPGGRLALGASQATAEQVGAANKATVAQMAPLLDQQASHLMAAYNNLEAPTYEQAKAVVEDAKAQLGGAPDHDHLDALVADPNAFDPDTFRAQIKMIADKSLAAGTQFKNELESGKLAIKQQEADTKNQRAETYAKSVDDKARLIDGNIARWEKDRAAKLQIAKMTSQRIANKQAVSQSSMKAMAEEIAHYRLELSPRFASPDLIRMVTEINPMWDAGKYKDMQKMRAEVTSGSISKTVAALNLGLPHIRTMMKAFDGLNNSDYPIFNKFSNMLSKGVGKADVPKFEAAAHIVATELAKVFKGGIPTKAEIYSLEKSFSPNMSPEQAKGVIRQSMEQMTARVLDIKDRAEQAYPGVTDFARLDDEAADAARELLGEKAGILGVKTKQGSSTDVNTQTGARSYTYPVQASVPAPAKQARRTATLADF